MKGQALLAPPFRNPYRRIAALVKNLGKGVKTVTDPLLALELPKGRKITLLLFPTFLISSTVVHMRLFPVQPYKRKAHGSSPSPSSKPLYITTSSAAPLWCVFVRPFLTHYSPGGFCIHVYYLQLARHYSAAAYCLNHRTPCE